jgi:hypothetical protein
MMHKTRLTIIVGAYGSGKTEFALNYAVKMAEQEKTINLVDLDIVNPYFRSRDLREPLEQQGIHIISSNPGLETADIPALSPEILSVLQNPGEIGIFDVGGDPVGARALGRFHPYIAQGDYALWMVINPFRPDTRSIDQLIEMKNSIEQASRLQITGLVDNTNLGMLTKEEDQRFGHALVDEASRTFQIPIVYRTESPDFPLVTGVEDIPVLPLKLYVRPDWLRSGE